MRKVLFNTESPFSNGEMNYRGYFHEFIDIKERKYAIIEDEDGYLHYTNLSKFKFVDHPESENNLNEDKSNWQIIDELMSVKKENERYIQTHFHVNAVDYLIRLNKHLMDIINQNNSFDKETTCRLLKENVVLSNLKSWVLRYLENLDSNIKIDKNIKDFLLLKNIEPIKQELENEK